MPPVDSRARNVGLRVNDLVQRDHGGDYRAAFNAYAQGGSEVSRSQVSKLLKDASVGNGLTRRAYTNGVMDRFDTDRNNAVSWNEFQAGMRATGVNIP